MIDWDSYSSMLSAEMRAVKNSHNMKMPVAGLRIAMAIANGYNAAILSGGDAVLGAPALLLPTGIAAMITSISAGMMSLSKPALVSAINTSVMAAWAGATLMCAACPPLEGHVGHAPIGIVIPTGVMNFVPPSSAAADEMDFINSLITAMKAHLAGLTGVHPTMMLPPPTPPYPLPWAAYQ